MSACTVPLCERPVRYRNPDLCGAHAMRSRRGDLLAWMPIGAGAKFHQPRLPYAPLRARGVSNSDVARVVGVSRRTVARWQRCGVPLDATESACDALGLHPCEVWGDEYLYAASCPVAALTAALQVGP